MATPQRNYSKKVPVRQVTDGDFTKYTMISGDSALLFGDRAGTPPPPRREINRPRPTRKVRPVKTQMKMNLLDRDDFALAGTATRVNDSDDDNPTSGPLPLPTPVKPKPVNPRGSTAVDIGDAPATLASPQMFDWPVLATAGISLTPSEQGKHSTKTHKPKPRRDCTSYELAKAREKDFFLKLLAELCQGITEPPQGGVGRPAMLMRDMVYSVVHKVYSLSSYERHTKELGQAKTLGYISDLPHYTTVCRYMNKPELTHKLMDLVAASAVTMEDIDSRVITEPTEFATSQFVRWFNHLWGGDINTREWLKVNLDCGADSKVVTAVTIPGWNAHNTSFFVPLMDRIYADFDPYTPDASQAHLMDKTIHLAMLAGEVPQVPFLSRTKIAADSGNGIWPEMYDAFLSHSEDLDSHYHQRDEAETAVRLIHLRFGDSLRSKNHLAQVNETLAMVICHNVVESYKAMLALGLSMGHQP